MSATPVEGRDSLPKVVFWMTATLLSFAGLAVAIREVTRTVSVFDAMTMVSLAGVVAFLAIATARGELRTLRPAAMATHAVRNTVQFAGTYAWATAVTILPLAQVFAIEFSTPVFTAAFAILLIGERLTKGRIAAIALGALGILVIYAPHMGRLEIGSFLPLMAAAAFALSGVLTRKITRTQGALAILFWMNAMQLPMNFAGSGRAFWNDLTPDMTIPVLCMCACGAFGHFALAKALSYGDAIVVAPLDVLKIPLAAAVGWFLYEETVGATLFAGVAIVLAGNVTGIVSEVRDRKAFLLSAPTR